MRILNLFTRLFVGVIPWLVIACLLYVGLFVKPEPIGSTVKPTAIESRDRFYSLVAIDTVLWAVGADGKIVRKQFTLRYDYDCRNDINKLASTISASHYAFSRYSCMG